MSEPTASPLQRRVYPLDANELTEEQIAVAFAMTSRRPEPFDEIASQVSREKAADFHERWVLGYGHSSVAEHAVLHLAVENVSRLACDTLEDNRLASYTEKSSRYQVLDQGAYHFPTELEALPELGKLYTETCNSLFRSYNHYIDVCMAHLRSTVPQREGERNSAYTLRLRREVTDSCRSILPAAAFTNVGVTANARVLEHAISKLRSSQLAEERELGSDLLEQGRQITPTLIKYAEANEYLQCSAEQQTALSLERVQDPRSGPEKVSLVCWDERATEKLAAALLYRHSSLGYEDIQSQVQGLDELARHEIIRRCLEKLGPHDAPLREFELVDYTFEFLLDYGAYREFKRHRMQSYLTQSLTVARGYSIPALIGNAGLEEEFVAAMDMVGDTHARLLEQVPIVASYVVTHAHYRRVLTKINLRECYHLFKLRTSSQAHESIRSPIQRALDLAKDTHPALFIGLQQRD